MRTESRAYSNKIYKEFLAIESGEYKAQVLYVDMNRERLNDLAMEEYVRVIDIYGAALFELGEYSAHIEVADELIEISIMHNVQFIGQKDLYQEALFQKAASLYNLQKLDKAIYILRELVKINPENESAKLFLINCYVRQRDGTLQATRLVSIVTILLSACIIAVELIVVRPRFPDLTYAVEMTRNLMFLCGTAILITGEAIVRYRAVLEVYRFSGKARKVRKRGSH